MKIGDKAPGFSGLKGVDGKIHDLSDYTTQIVVLIFSCNHCPTVIAYEDRMIKIQRDYTHRGVTLIAINPNDASKYPTDNYQNMIKRAQEKGFNFPYLRDESQNVARDYGAQRTPEIFVLDKERILRYHGRIDDNANDPTSVRTPDLRDALEALLEGRKIRVAETAPVGCTIKWK